MEPTPHLGCRQLKPAAQVHLGPGKIAVQAVVKADELTVGVGQLRERGWIDSLEACSRGSASSAGSDAYSGPDADLCPHDAAALIAAGAPPIAGAGRHKPTAAHLAGSTDLVGAEDAANPLLDPPLNLAAGQAHCLSERSRSDGWPTGKSVIPLHEVSLSTG